ncbi:MAG: OB-fold nucleic acid binding domain-containing protein [Alistipes sp.]|nr:OB-fold nucleic acid binding domain-containing protein [Alistipes sp.]
MKITKYLSIIALSALALWSCEKDYNSQFEGFEEKTQITDVRKNVEYQLADADYKSIAENSQNKALAEAEGAEERLARLTNNKYFESEQDAIDWVPAFLANSNTWRSWSPGSTMQVSVNVAKEVPEALLAMREMKSYELAEEDYEDVTGSADSWYLTADTEKNIAAALSADDYEEGDYVAVAYQYFEGAGGDAPTNPEEREFTDVLGKAKLNEEVDVCGWITAIHSNGMVLTDKGGSILLYKIGDAENYSLGDVVTVKGKVEAFNTGFQIQENGLASIKKSKKTVEVKYPRPTTLDAAFMEQVRTREADTYEIFVKVTDATVIKSDKNYNFNFDDNSNDGVGGFYGVTDELKAKLDEKDGQKVSFYGYLNSVSKSSNVPKYIQVIVTHFETEPEFEAESVAAAAVAPMAVTRAASPVTKYAVCKYDGSAFELVSDVAVVQPADYASMGQNNSFANGSEATLLPKYLSRTYPYADAEDVISVAYIAGDSWTADRYAFDGSIWSKVGTIDTIAVPFMKESKTAWRHYPVLLLEFTTQGTKEASFVAFCQYCANWIYDNVDYKLGAPERDNAGVIVSNTAITVGGGRPEGNFFVSNYGNNEWYAGTYAFYGELNWDSSKAMNSFKNAAAVMKEKAEAGTPLDVDLGVDYQTVLSSNLKGADLVKAMQQNSIRVFEAVLSHMYPETSSSDYGSCVINIWNYYNKEEEGTKKGVYTYTFTIDGPGEFKYVKDSFGFVE